MKIMCIVISHQGNVNQNLNEISLHFSGIGHYQKDKRISKCGEEKREPLHTAGENVNKLVLPLCKIVGLFKKWDWNHCLIQHSLYWK